MPAKRSGSPGANSCMTMKDSLWFGFVFLATVEVTMVELFGVI